MANWGMQRMIGGTPAATQPAASSIASSMANRGMQYGSAPLMTKPLDLGPNYGPSTGTLGFGGQMGGNDVIRDTRAGSTFNPQPAYVYNGPWAQNPNWQPPSYEQAPDMYSKNPMAIGGRMAPNYAGGFGPILRGPSGPGLAALNQGYQNIAQSMASREAPVTSAPPASGYGYATGPVGGGMVLNGSGTPTSSPQMNPNFRGAPSSNPAYTQAGLDYMQQNGLKPAAWNIPQGMENFRFQDTSSPEAQRFNQIADQYGMGPAGSYMSENWNALNKPYWSQMGNNQTLGNQFINATGSAGLDPLLLHQRMGTMAYNPHAFDQLRTQYGPRMPATTAPSSTGTPFSSYQAPHEATPGGAGWGY